jgi:hypothetical protein
MLPGRANRSHASPWHLGQSLGGTTTPSGSNPQQRHWSWKIAVRASASGKGLYVMKWPVDPKRSMLIDICKTPSIQALWLSHTADEGR